LKGQIAALENELRESTYTIQQFNRDSIQLRNLLQESNSRVQKFKSAPPVVVIQDSGAFQFDSGSAALPQGLKKYISNPSC
jgi:hypothetical protein